jgi:excisionase family DNA binding protein
MLTLAEAASRLGFTEHHTRILARAGKLPGARKIGHSWRVRSDLLDSFLGSRDRARGSTEQPPSPMTPTTPAQREVLTAAEAADLLRISLRKLNEWVRLKHIPFCTLPGDTIRFRREQILEFLARNQAIAV